MKKLTILIAILMAANMLSAQWIQQDLYSSFYLDSDVKEILFVDENNGWISVDGLGPFYTINGGADWQHCNEIMNQTQSQEANISFTDINHGWINGSDGLWHTTNGSFGCESDWELQDAGIISFESSMLFFIDSLTGWYVIYGDGSGGYNSNLYRTIDGGINWIHHTLFFGSMISDIVFINTEIGWAIDKYNEPSPTGLKYTINGGASWTTINSSFRGTSLCFTDSQEGWIIGCNSYNGIWHTSDGGNSLEQQVGDSIPQLNDITFVDNMNGWAVGDEGTILHTINGGQTWEYQESGTSEDLNRMCFIDLNNGWICGDSGIVLHTDNGGIVGLHEVSNIQNNIAINPNPSTAITNIIFELEKLEEVTLVIQNLSGQEIKHISLGITKMGKYELNCTDLSSGLYFITLKFDSGILTEKLIIK